MKGLGTGVRKKCNNKYVYFGDTACTQQAQGSPAIAIYTWSCREAKDTSASLLGEFNSYPRSSSEEAAMVRLAPKA